MTDTAKTVGNFVPAVRSGNLLFVSGHISMRGGEPICGKAGAGMSSEDAYAAARTVADELLTTLEREAGSLDRVARIVKITGFVNAAPDFTGMSTVINGVSDRLVEVLGERGMHARSAIGVASLPLGAAVEAELIAEMLEPA